MTKHTMLEAFRHLQAEGFGLLDIGARGGIHHVFRDIAPLLHVVGFEPDAEEGKRLAEEAMRPSTIRSLTYLPWALGETDCPLPSEFILAGPTAVVFGAGDPCRAAKKVQQFGNQ